MARGFRITFSSLVISTCLLISASSVSGIDTAKSGPVPISPELICPLLNGQKIPTVTLKNSEGELFDLIAVIAKKPAILIFYRGGW